MGFGSAAKKTAQKQQRTSDAQNENVFFDIKNGNRVFRLVPGFDEIRIKQHWMARNTDGTWEPVFGFNENDKRDRKPITVAVFDPNDGEFGSWGAWWENPINEWVDNADADDETKKKWYAKEVFYVNVLNRTMVKTDGDTIHYPDTRNQYPAGTEKIVARMVDRIQILSGSSGKIRDENGDITGKHLYASLLRVIEGGEIDVESGLPLDPTTYDVRLRTTGKKIETVREFSITANRDVIDWTQYEAFDLANWQRPWPEDAINALFDGADYMTVVKEYNIQLYPNRVPVIPVADDDIPF